MSLPAQHVSPKATPLPPLPAENPLTPAQWRTLLAITDAVIPAIKPMSTAIVKNELAITDNEFSTAMSAISKLTPENDPGADDAAREYLADNASSNPAFKTELQRIFAMYLPDSQKKQLLMIMSILKYVYPRASEPRHLHSLMIFQRISSEFWAMLLPLMATC